MQESSVLKLVWYAIAATSTIFRLNTGKAWQSSLGPKGVGRTPSGAVHIQAPRMVSVGFGKPNGDPLVGAYDLDGWTPKLITIEMVGCTVAVFTSIECKATKGGRVSEDQENWGDQVRKAGGIAGVAKTPEEAQAIIANWAPIRLT